MATTALSVTATPGKPHSFLPKTEAVPESGPHTGTFTELSVTAIPGKIHSFSAKSPVAPVSGPHEGEFTALSVTATPGMRHTFVAKAAAAVAVVARDYGGEQFPEKFVISQAKAQELQEKIVRDDNEIMEILAILLGSEIL